LLFFFFFFIMIHHAKIAKLQKQKRLWLLDVPCDISGHETGTDGSSLLMN